MTITRYKKKLNAITIAMVKQMLGHHYSIELRTFNTEQNSFAKLCTTERE